MPTITLPHGTLHYVRRGPTETTNPPVVFVHGVLVDGTLWAGVGEALADAGTVSYALDLPLGAHRHPMAADADQSPRGIARLVIGALEALELENVTLVGNDSGGAICQYVLDTDASRIGRLLLTNCDAFEQFPPPSLGKFIELIRRPTALAAAGHAMRSTRVRHGSLGFGPFANELDPAMTAAWVEPLRDSAVRRDVARLAEALDPDELVAIGARLDRFAGPVRVVWGTADPYFSLDLARRIVAAFADAELVEVEGARTFVPLDAPDRVAAEIVDLAARAGRSGGAAERSA